MFVKRKDGEPFRFIIHTFCGCYPETKPKISLATTANQCQGEIPCGVTCDKPPLVEVEPNVNQQCPYKLFIKRAKETLSIQANHPEYLKGLKNTIASVMKGLGNSFLLFPCR